MADKVWWFRPDEHPAMTGTGISPWPADPSTTLKQLAELSMKVRNGEIPFTDEDKPSALFFRREGRPDVRTNPDDFLWVAMGGLVISEAMFDLLSDFDLGDSQLIELPLHDGKPHGRADRAPDFDKPLPGRWFLLHITARKDSFVFEASREVIPPSGSMLAMPNVPYQRDLRVALNQTALKGTDLWREVGIFGDFIFLSDRLKSALITSGLKIDKLRFYPCAIV